MAVRARDNNVIDRIDPIRADIAKLRHHMEVTLEKGLREQTRWMLGGLALILTAILFKG